MKRTILLAGICCALTAPAATVNAAKSVTKSAEAPTQEAINNALTELLAERESWSGAAAPGSASPAGTDVAGITAGATGDLSAFLAQRTTWGQGPAAKAINAPLAKGASSSFPRSETVAAPGPSPQTIVQPEVARPLPKLALVSQADIVRARNALLSERDSWGKEPSLAAMPALSVIETYFAERDSWGKGPAAEPVSAPLAKGATKKLTFASRLVVAEATSKTIVHEFKPQPLVQLAQVDQSQINKAMQDLLAEREGWGTTPAAASAQGATATGGTGDMAALLAEREGWGTGPKPRTIKAPLAKGAEAKVRLSKTGPVGDSKPPIIQELEARPIPVVADIDMATINKAMQDLLAEREGWGTTPAAASAQGATATGGTGDMAALLAEREGWGTGPKPRTIKAPLAKGAEAKVRLSKTGPVGDSKPPIIQELEARPIPVVADIDMATINKAMQDLLAEREGWGTTPAAASAQGATATGGTGDMAALLAEREGWGTGPKPRTIKAPLAKGAEAKVRLSKTGPVGNSKPPIIQELEARPIPVVADIDMATINKAMQDLLAEREGWGTTPAAASAQGCHGHRRHRRHGCPPRRARKLGGKAVPIEHIDQHSSSGTGSRHNRREPSQLF